MFDKTKVMCIYEKCSNFRNKHSVWKRQCIYEKFSISKIDRAMFSSNVQKPD